MYQCIQYIHKPLTSGHQIEDILYTNFENGLFIGLKFKELDDIKRSYKDRNEREVILFQKKMPKKLFICNLIVTVSYLS